MSGNIIQGTFDDFMKSAGFSKRNGSWYRTSGDVITVVELQKSQYGPQYYVNVALWLRALGEAKAPKEQACHVRTRLSRLVGADEYRLSGLLDLNSASPDDQRADELSSLLRRHFLPVLDAVKDLEGLHGSRGQSVLDASLVTAPARRLLAT
jgi:hypothetical protein